MSKLGGLKKNKNDLPVIGPAERRITPSRAGNLPECRRRSAAQVSRFSGNHHVLFENSLTTSKFKRHLPLLVPVSSLPSHTKAALLRKSRFI